MFRAVTDFQRVARAQLSHRRLTASHPGGARLTRLRGPSTTARSKRRSRVRRALQFAPVAAASAIAAAGGSVGGGTVGVLSARALLSVDAALLTLLLCRCLSGFTSTRFFTQPVRAAIADFGPAVTVLAMTMLSCLPAVERLGSLTRLDLPAISLPGKRTAGALAAMAQASAGAGASVATGAAAATGRGRKGALIAMGTLPVRFRVLALLPAMFLATLFFLDQNITVRTVNSPSNKLSKGAAYHQDLLALGLITGLVSVFGLPWMCSATVQVRANATDAFGGRGRPLSWRDALSPLRAQSLNHVRAMAQYGSPSDDGSTAEGNGSSAQTASEGAESANAPIATTNAPSLLPADKAQGALMNAAATPSGDSTSLVAAVGREDAVAAKASAPTADGFIAAPTLSSTTVDLGLNSSPSTEPADAPSKDGQSAGAVASEDPSSSGASGGASSTAAATSVALSLTKVEKSDSSSEMQITSVVETRLTGFMVHALVLASLAFVPLLRSVPLAVIAGVFLHLGLKVMSGNQFLGRCKALVLDEAKLDLSRPDERSILELGRLPVLQFTLAQVACLAMLWGLKQSEPLAMVFPSVIGVLLLIRAKVLPRFFTRRQLLTLDTEYAGEGGKASGKAG